MIRMRIRLELMKKVIEQWAVQNWLINIKNYFLVLYVHWSAGHRVSPVGSIIFIKLNERRKLEMRRLQISNLNL